MIKSTISLLPIGKPALAYAFAKAKMRTEALQLINEFAKSARDYCEMAGVASIYLALGMNEQCLLWLEKAYADGDLEPGFLFKFYPWFNELWANEKFRSSHGEKLPKHARHAPTLDEFLGSGLPAQSTLLVVGGPRVGKEAIGYRVMNLGVLRGDFCLYVTGRSVTDVLRDMQASGIKKNNENELFWIASEGGAMKYNVNDLSELSFNVKEVLKKNSDHPIRIVLDILSPLLMLNSPETVYRFLSQLFGEVKRYNATLLATLEEGMHEQQAIAAMEQLFDGVLEVRSSQDATQTGRMVHVMKLRGVSVPDDSRSYVM